MFSICTLECWSYWLLQKRVKTFYKRSATNSQIIIYPLFNELSVILGLLFFHSSTMKLLTVSALLCAMMAMATDAGEYCSVIEPVFSLWFTVRALLSVKKLNLNPKVTMLLPSQSLNFQLTWVLVIEFMIIIIFAFYSYLSFTLTDCVLQFNHLSDSYLLLFNLTVQSPVLIYFLSWF